jgi:hypothetical protein
MAAVPQNFVKADGTGVLNAAQMNTLTQACDTAADLRNFVGIQNQMVTLGGIAAINDGLGGLFIAVLGAGTDDNKNTIVPTGQTGMYWARVAQNTSSATAQVNSAIEFRLDGGGSVPSTGVIGDMRIPFAFTIPNTSTAWSLICDTTGAMVLDIWATPYVSGGTPPTVANTITASATPGFLFAENLAGAPTGWTTSFTGQTWLRFNLVSISTITRFTLTLAITK